MRFYLDTSALVPIHVGEASSAMVSDALGALASLPLISNFGVGEFGSVISRYVRMELVSPPVAADILATFDHWLASSADLLRITSEDIARASEIVRQFDLKLRFPDSIHIAICANRALTLITRDQQMAGAAKAMGVNVMDLR